MDKPSGVPPMPGLSAFTDSFEMMKRMWSFPGVGPTPTLMPGAGGQLPSMFLPTMDVGELDKRIADLRSVEQWLNLNASMLRTTIQTLEVQRNTLAALQAFGGTMFGNAASAAAASPPGQSTAGSADARARARGRTGGKGDPDSAATGPAAADPAAMPFNPAQWWSTLQQQFMQVAAAAMTDPNAPAKAAPIDDAAPGDPAPSTSKGGRKA